MKYNLDCPHYLWTVPMTVKSDIKVLHICYSDIFFYNTEILYILKKMFKLIFAFQLCQKRLHFFAGNFFHYPFGSPPIHI